MHRNLEEVKWDPQKLLSFSVVSLKSQVMHRHLYYPVDYLLHFHSVSLQGCVNCQWQVKEILWISEWSTDHCVKGGLSWILPESGEHILVDVIMFTWQKRKTTEARTDSSCSFKVLPAELTHFLQRRFFSSSRIWRLLCACWNLSRQVATETQGTSCRA